MKIAIVDDQEQDRAALAARLREYMTSRSLSCEYVEFSSAEQFLEEFRPGNYTIVFMDIYMDELSGMDAARRVYLEDKECRIIFLTTTPDFSLQSYSVHAVYYLVKPLEQTAFEQALEFCSLKSQDPVSSLKIRSAGVEMSLDTSQIFYIEYKNRTTNIHLRDSVVPASGSFHSITSGLLPDRRFLLCIRGLMVNMEHIVCQDDDTFLLTNGERVPINIRNKKAIGQSYRSYVFETIGGKR